MRNSILLVCSLLMLSCIITTDISAQEVNGRNVMFVSFGNASGQIGSFARKNNKVWKEEGVQLGDTKFTYKEVKRNRRNVFLRDDSRGVDIQIDLVSKKIFYSDANTPKESRFHIIQPYAKPDGRIVTRVTFGDGANTTGLFRMRNDQVWAEKGSDSSAEIFIYQEVKREPTSVFLRDDSRGVDVQLNLQTGKVIFTKSKGPVQQQTFFIEKSS